MADQNEYQLVASEAMLQINKQEMDNAVAIAKQYPRDITIVKAKVLQYATCDEETAKSCFFAKPVDNKGTIATGPSIRLAEIIATTYQNIKYGSRVLDISERWVTVQGIAFDMENNLSYTSEVKRSIWSDKGKYRYSQNMVETTIKAASAIAVRDAIYKVVPMGLFNAELKKIKALATGADSSTPLTARALKAIESFKKFNVTEKMILTRLEIDSVSKVTEEHLETLIGLYTAINDKEVTADEAFIPNKINKESRDERIAGDLASTVKGTEKKTT